VGTPKPLDGLGYSDFTVRIERLARDLGTSKSGFYWHFTDRRDLLLQLAEYWSHEYTEILSENVELRMLEPRTRLTRVAELILEHDLSGYDLAFRSWAARDPEIARRVNAVIRKHLKYVQQAFAELGFEGAELEMRARLFVSYQTSERALFSTVSRKKLQALVPLADRDAHGPVIWT